MAGIWADFPSGSQGIYGDDETAMLDGLYTDVSFMGLTDDPDPAIGAAGRVITAVSSNNGSVLLAIPSAQAKVGIKCSVWMPILPISDANRVIVGQWRTNLNVVIAYAFVTPTGAISFVNATSETAPPTYTTPGPVVTAGAYHSIECALTCSLGGAAEIEIRVNGAPKLTESGFTTSAATASIIGHRVLTVTNGCFPSFKNTVYWDGSGAEVNDFQGNVSVFYNPIVTDITTGGWTLSSGSNMSALIGVVGPPNDANYIAADDTPPAAARAALAGLPPDITSVRFIVPVVRAWKVDGGDGNLQLSLSPNGVDYDTGPDTPITTAATYWGNAASPFVSHLNPQTSAPWSPADFIAGVELQIDRTI